MKKSNCHIRAWSHFVRGNAEWICYRKTRYASLHAISHRWWWAPFRVVGIALQWTGSIVFFIGWYLRWLGWYHVAWVLPNGEWWEYVPPGEKRYRAVAPLVFKGNEQKFETEVKT